MKTYRAILNDYCTGRVTGDTALSVLRAILPFVERETLEKIMRDALTEQAKEDQE